MAKKSNRNKTRHIGEPIEESTGLISRGRNLVVTIGIDDYTYWPKLHRAVSDAVGVQKLLVEKFGFLAPYASLLNGAATAENIRDLVLNKLDDLLQPDDSLVIFFAGHGDTRVRKVGNAEVESGYIIPVEAHRDRWGDYIGADALLQDVGQLSARHVLVILDACRSGIALGDAMQLHRSPVRYEQDLAGRLSRKVITSARRDQDALDGGPIPGHSLFTGTLVEGLNWGTADLDGNSLVTSLELGLYLQQRVGQASASKQTPDFGAFHLDNRGELVISLRDDNFDAVKARAFAAMLQHNVPELSKLVAQLVALTPDRAETRYLQSRLNFMQDNLDRAVEMVALLLNSDFESGMIPLTKGDLSALKIQLDFWRPVLSIPIGNPPIEVRFFTGATPDTLTAAPLQPFSGGNAYQVDDGAVAQFEVCNLGSVAAHLYTITITPHGRLLIGPLLENDESRIVGLAPGATERGPKFRVIGLPRGITETRIFYSPQRISSMLFPATTATRSLERLDATDPFYSPNSALIPIQKAAPIAEMQRVSIWHQITGSLSQQAITVDKIEQIYGMLTGAVFDRL